jgi:hypothetical protein
MDTKTLINKLTDIELSIGVRSNNELRHMVINVQDGLLQMQRERAETLRVRSRYGAVRATPYGYISGLFFHRGWLRAVAAIRPRGDTVPDSEL